jgi:hypothetical protein
MKRYYDVLKNKRSTNRSAYSFPCKKAVELSPTDTDIAKTL